MKKVIKKINKILADIDKIEEKEDDVLSQIDGAIEELEESNDD